MDDYKRALHMSAQRFLSERKTTYVCRSFERVLFEEDVRLKDQEDRDSVIEELFPEFFKLADGQFWTKGTIALSITADASTAWWEHDWYEPRIRALDCILNNDIRPSLG